MSDNTITAFDAPRFKIFTFLARIMAILAIFSLPLFPDIVKFALPCAAILMLFAGGWQEKYALLRQNYVVPAGVILVALFLFGMLYSSAPFADILTGFFKYTKILYMIFLLPLFTEARWRRIATNTLILAIFLDIAVSFLGLHGAIIINKNLYPAGYMQYPITTAAILGFISFVLLNRCIDEKNYRWVYGVLFLVAIYSLFFVYTKRTGQLIFFVLLLLTFWQRLGWRGALMAIIVVPLTAGILFMTSTRFHSRIIAGTKEAITYVETDQAHNTSVGDRLAFAQYSFKVIKANPILGAGTGSFRTVYAKTGGPMVVQGSLLQDPHNEFTMIAFQLGFVGLLWFLIWLVIQWRTTKQLPLHERRLAQGVIASFITISFCDTALFIGLSGLFYVIFLSVYFAASVGKQKAAD